MYSPDLISIGNSEATAKFLFDPELLPPPVFHLSLISTVRHILQSSDLYLPVRSLSLFSCGVKTWSVHSSLTTCLRVARDFYWWSPHRPWQEVLGLEPRKFKTGNKRSHSSMWKGSVLPCCPRWGIGRNWSCQTLRDRRHLRRVQTSLHPCQWCMESFDALEGLTDSPR